MISSRRLPAAMPAMLLALVLPSPAYADPAGSGPIVGALNWLRDTLLGNVATAVAVIAVAMVGFMMLTGRHELAVRRERDPGLLHPVRRGLDRRRHPVDRRSGAVDAAAAC